MSKSNVTVIVSGYEQERFIVSVSGASQRWTKFSSALQKEKRITLELPYLTDLVLFGKVIDDANGEPIEVTPDNAGLLKKIAKYLGHKELLENAKSVIPQSQARQCLRDLLALDDLPDGTEYDSSELELVMTQNLDELLGRKEFKKVKVPAMLRILSHPQRVLKNPRELVPLVKELIEKCDSGLKMLLLRLIPFKDLDLPAMSQIASALDPEDEILLPASIVKENVRLRRQLRVIAGKLDGILVPSAEGPK